jgi:hypothetical protein
MARHHVWGAICVAALIGCGDDSESSSRSSGGGTTSQGGMGGAGGAQTGGGGAGGMALPIPECGPGMDEWVDNASFPGSTTAADIGTPETAWQVGTATQSTPYVQANISPDTGHAFFVFCAGPALNEISIALNTADGGDFTTIHIHDGTDGVLGAEVTPTMTNAVGGSWPLTPGGRYVLEIANNPGSFF